MSSHDLWWKAFKAAYKENGGDGQAAIKVANAKSVNRPRIETKNIMAPPLVGYFSPRYLVAEQDGKLVVLANSNEFKDWAGNVYEGRQVQSTVTVTELKLFRKTADGCVEDTPAHSVQLTRETTHGNERG